MIEIIPYRDEHQPWFERFNRDWIEKTFWMEPMDFEVLQHPDKYILEAGGEIFMALYENEVAGTVAMKYEEAGVYELAKMAVDERFRGKKVGKTLLQAAIQWAVQKKLNRIILSSSTKLPNAISLYRSFGFYEIKAYGTFKRSDISMELKLTD